MEATLRALAAADIEAAVAYYRDEAGEQVALDFVDALEAAIATLCDQPLIGSLRFAYELEIPHLRAWPLSAYPYLLFYVPDEEHVDVWRVLHAKRDIPSVLVDDEDAEESAG